MANPKLIPLQQWYCDTCGKIIEQPEHGYIEWRYRMEDERRQAHDFQIVHHAPHSPKHSQGGDCYYRDAKGHGEIALPHYLGPAGIVRLLSWIDEGAEFNEVYKGPSVADLREWTVLFQRLHLPFYEEARAYLVQAREGYFNDCNDISIHQPEYLKNIIERYGPANG
jgi:hypothetical protein